MGLKIGYLEHDSFSLSELKTINETASIHDIGQFIIGYHTGWAFPCIGILIDDFKVRPCLYNQELTITAYRVLKGYEEFLKQDKEHIYGGT